MCFYRHDPVNHIHPFQNLAEDRVPGTIRARAVEHVVVHDIDEELCGSAVRGRCSGHGKGAAIIFQAVGGLILDRCVGRFLLAISGKTAALCHEAGDDAVKDGAAIKTSFDIIQKIFDADGRFFLE